MRPAAGSHGLIRAPAPGDILLSLHFSVSVSGSAPVSQARQLLLLLFRLPQPRRLNSIPFAAARVRSQGRAGGFLLASPGRRGQSSAARSAGLGRGREWEGGGRRRRRREGRCCPLGLLRLVPAAARGSGERDGEERRVRSRGFGFSPEPRAGLAGGPRRAGGRASARAGGPPSPALAGAQPQGHVERLGRKPSPGEGGESRLGPPLTGGATPAGGGGGGSPGLPSQLLSEGRRPAGRRAEALGSGEAAAVASSTAPRCARFKSPGKTEIQTAEAAAAAPSPRPRWG